MTVLNPTTQCGYQNSEVEELSVMAEHLFNEYGLLGYSLTVEDIEIALINDVRFYAGWEETYQQEKGESSVIDRSYKLAVNEWAVLEPVIRAHCDFIQAQRVEGTGSLGGERFGLTVSEASQNYSNAKDVMKKEAFVEGPFTITFG